MLTRVLLFLRNLFPSPKVAPALAARSALSPDELGVWAARYGAAAVNLDLAGHIVGVQFFERSRDVYGRKGEPDAADPEAPPMSPVDAALHRLTRQRVA